jgi:cyanophycin synthetase
LVERQYTWQEYRVFATSNKYYAVSHREPANIIWDGKHTIGQLIEKENFRRMNPRTTCLCTIKVDDVSDKFLRDRWIYYSDKPLRWEKVYIRPNSNVSGWANCRDVTDMVHKWVFQVADRILKCFKWLDYVGIDYMTPDIMLEQAQENYIICELNSCPGISLHTHEETWAKRNVPKVMVDYIFPETIYNEKIC